MKSSDSNKNISLSGQTHPPKAKYSLTAPPHPPKVKYSQMVTESQQHKRPTSQPHSQRRRYCRGKPHHREEDGQLNHQSVGSHSFQANTREATRVQCGESVQLAGATHPPKVKYFNCYYSSHSRTTTPSQSEISANLPKCQQNNKQLTTSTLRAIFSVTKTHKRL